MKKTIVLLVLCATTVLMVRCSHKTASAVSKSKSESPQETVAELKQDFPPEKIMVGKALYENNCNKCHQLYDPQGRDVAEWEKVLKQMLPKTDLNEGDKDLVRAYLLINARVS